MVVLIGQRTEENSAIRRLNGELEQANDRLSVLNEQLKAYAAESERMAETRERNRLAREIHDTLGHALTGITAGADACLQMLEISPEMAKKQMERIAATAREGMNEVRRSVRALRPDALERMQLTDALGKLCTEMQTTSQAEVTLDLQADELRLSPDEEDAVYRIVQESITNAIRHGHATAVRVCITAAERRLGITVTDNGCGCTKIEPGFGLRHMRERLKLLNGTLKVKSENGAVRCLRLSAERRIGGRSDQCGARGRARRLDHRARCGEQGTSDVRAHGQGQPHHRRGRKADRGFAG